MSEKDEEDAKERIDRLAWIRIKRKREGEVLKSSVQGRSVPKFRSELCNW